MTITEAIEILETAQRSIGYNVERLKQDREERGGTCSMPSYDHKYIKQITGALRKLGYVYSSEMLAEVDGEQV